MTNMVERQPEQIIPLRNAEQLPGTDGPGGEAGGQPSARTQRKYFLRTWRVRCTTDERDAVVDKRFQIFAGPDPDKVGFLFPSDFDSRGHWSGLTQGTFDAEHGTVNAQLNGYSITMSRGLPACCPPMEGDTLWCVVSKIGTDGDVGQAQGEFGAEDG